MITVAEVLELPTVRVGLPEVVAGADHLDRQVRWAHVLDVAEVSGLLKGGEFILNNGFGLGLDARTQRSFIRQLAEQDAAAVAIELGILFRHRLPAALCDEAERLRLPLIVLHRKTRFVEVTEAVHQQVMGADFALLRQADDASRRLTALAVTGAPLGSLLGEMARIISNPVLLEDASGTLVEWAADRADPDLVLRTWQSLLDAERHEDHPRGAIVAPVRFADGPGGRLIALELDRPLSELARTVVARGAEVLSLQVASRRRADELAARSRGTLLGDLIGGRLSERAAAQRATALAFTRRSSVMLPVAIDWCQHRDRMPAPSWSTLAAQVRAGLHRRGLGSLVGPRGRQLVLLVDPGHGGDEDRLTAEVADAIHAVLDHEAVPQQDLVLAIGSPAHDFLAAGRALDRTARHAAAVAAARMPAAPWHDARRIGLVDVLFALRESPVLAEFVADRLGSLVNGNDRRRDELTQTLEAYLRHAGSKTDAARELHLERQSIYHRLDRLQGLLDVDWSNGEELLEVHLALQAHRLFDAA